MQKREKALRWMQGRVLSHLLTPPTSETNPPAAVMRLRSVSLCGLWSLLSARACPPRHNTARLSPALATQSSFPFTTATTAVQPACTEPQHPFNSLIASMQLCSGTTTKAAVNQFISKPGRVNL